MIKNCKIKNCDLCNKCDGNGACIERSACPKKYDIFIKHKCNNDCELSSCPCCKHNCSENELEVSNGFCSLCYSDLYYNCVKLFNNDGRVHTKFMNSMFDLFEFRNKNE